MESKSVKKILIWFCLLILCLLNNGINAAGKTIEAHKPCNGTILECNEGDELLMVSEITRRILKQGRYISIGAMSREQPACSGGARGQSYSRECLPHPSNPQSRGCSRYYRCRSDA